jgi:hypothetical protein
MAGSLYAQRANKQSRHLDAAPHGGLPSHLELNSSALIKSGGGNGP